MIHFECRVNTEKCRLKTIIYKIRRVIYFCWLGYFNCHRYTSLIFLKLENNPCNVCMLAFCILKSIVCKLIRNFKAICFLNLILLSLHIIYKIRRVIYFCWLGYFNCHHCDDSIIPFVCWDDVLGSADLRKNKNVAI
jgi:hypothetical protein